MHLLVGCISHYEVCSAHAHLDAAASPEVEEAVASATWRVYFDDPLRLSEPYWFYCWRAGRPPDNAFTCFIAIAGIVLLFASVLGYHLYLFQNQEGTKMVSLPTGNTHHVALTSTMDVCKECSDTSHSFDSDGIPFVIDNSAACIICNNRSQFVGPLHIQHTSVKTTHCGSPDSHHGQTITESDSQESPTPSIMQSHVEPDSHK